MAKLTTEQIQTLTNRLDAQLWWLNTHCDDVANLSASARLDVQARVKKIEEDFKLLASQNDGD
ncbi:hypothetical protein [Mesorhizobium sp.]|uniref:hypothetical protein n=1 Tax=Mesorhizobium sp. TaxID=1871066 RepID=UPI000FD5BC2A|nr:hypothetical protein [Mesorhizobium sp.]RVC64478.1 hypothetical protein EN779_01685 [Mesorhizobium sp. M4B.F.Ca.ET.088.02.2.1]RWF28348.1 MAG: hypothetical protein EOS45_22690 [Mesorhizobium sp.]